MKRIFVIYIFILSCIFLSQPLSYSAENIPPYPCDFYGEEESPNTLTTDAWIYAVDPDGVSIGRFRITTDGQYGFLSCSADDPNTPEDEGAVDGDIITFYILGVKQQKQAVFKSGDAVNIDLGIPADLGLFNLHLTYMPAYLSYNQDIRYSGVAVADMILDFLDPSNTDTQPALMTYADHNSDNITAGAELSKLLNDKAPNAYNFGATSEIQRYSEWGIIDTFSASNQSDVIKQLCHWIAYKVPNTAQGKEYVPVAVCTSSDPATNADSDYQHWMSVVGIKTNQDPHPSLSDYASFREIYHVPESLALSGLYINDPNTGGLGFHQYVSANFWATKYFRPIAAGLEETGKYVAVMEPPEPQALSVSIIPSFYNKSLQFVLTTPQQGISVYIPNWVNPTTKQYLLKLLNQMKESKDFIILLEDSYFKGALDNTKVSRCYKVDSKTNDDYTIVPFEKNISGKTVTTAAAIMNNETGQFQIAFADPDADSIYKPLTFLKAYQVLRKHIGYKTKEYLINRWLCNAEGSPLYPGWTIVSLKQEQKENILIFLSKEYTISQELKILEEKSSPQINILYNRRYKYPIKTVTGYGRNYTGSYTTLLIFEAADADVSIDWKRYETMAYLYNSGSRYFVILRGKNPACRIKIVDKGSSGNIREGGVTYLYIR